LGWGLFGCRRGARSGADIRQIIFPDIDITILHANGMRIGARATNRTSLRSFPQGERPRFPGDPSGPHPPSPREQRKDFRIKPVVRAKVAGAHLAVVHLTLDEEDLATALGEGLSGAGARGATADDGHAELAVQGGTIGNHGLGPDGPLGHTGLHARGLHSGDGRHFDIPAEVAM